MRNVDIRASHPYFRVKRGLVTVFLDASSNDTVLSTKRRLVSMLKEHAGGDTDLLAATEDTLRLVVEVSPQQSDLEQQPVDRAAAQYRALDDIAKIGAAGLVDEQIIYFVLKLADGSWEEPVVEDYDAAEMDLSHS